MARHKFGLADGAKASLAAAEKANDADPPWYWANRLQWQLLHDEADRLIPGN